MGPVKVFYRKFFSFVTKVDVKSKKKFFVCLVFNRFLITFWLFGKSPRKVERLKKLSENQFCFGEMGLAAWGDIKYSWTRWQWATSMSRDPFLITKVFLPFNLPFWWFSKGGGKWSTMGLKSTKNWQISTANPVFLISSLKHNFVFFMIIFLFFVCLSGYFRFSFCLWK